jgi:LDH2 family malate/lactate/ureidoglycolate dehydrogenase
MLGEMASEHYRNRSKEGISIEETTLESYKRLAEKYSIKKAKIVEK